MLVYEKLREDGSGGPPPTEIPKGADMLGITPEIFDRIQKSGQGENFRRDLEATKSNPNEKLRFELLYLKGYGQVAKYKGNDGTEKEITFGELARMNGGEKDEIVSQLGRSMKIRFKEFEMEAANQRVDEKREVKQAANQEERELEKGILAANQEERELEKGILAANQEERELDEQRISLDRKLAEQVNNIGTISGVEKGDIGELRKNADRIPELNGANPNDIARGKYDNIILADFYEKNDARLRTDIKNPVDLARFDNSIRNLRLTLGRPVSFDKAISGINLGENRDKIESRGRELIDRGYSKEVVWNSRDRSITFENKLGDKYVIDTTPIPPRERIVRNGLSIDQAIPEESKESVQYKKTVQGIQEKQKKNEDEIGENSKKLSGIVLDEKNPIIKDKEKLGTVALLEERDKQYGKIKTSEGKTEEKIAAITELLRINQEIKGKNLNQIMSEGDIDVSKLNSQLESEGELLNKLKKSLNTRIELEKTSALNEKNKPKDVRDNFESIAKSNLSFLIDLGYDKIGQQTLDKVVASLNAEYKGVNGDSSYVDLSREELDNQQKQRILLGLTRLMHVNGRGLMPEWDHVNNDDQFIAYRQTRSPLWNVSLQNLGKKPEYQSLVNNTDITKFRNQVIGREKPPEKSAEAPK